MAQDGGFNNLSRTVLGHAQGPCCVLLPQLVMISVDGHGGPVVMKSGCQHGHSPSAVAPWQARKYGVAKTGCPRRTGDRPLIMNVIVAEPEHAPSVARLFDMYRVFYEQPSDPDGALAFVASRLEFRDSVVLCVVEGDDMLGFTQLYPSFTSVGMKPIWILNDLFVDPDARRRGVATLLLQAAREHARKTGAAKLTLETAVTNSGAQALYEAEGWTRDDEYCTYSLPT